MKQSENGRQSVRKSLRQWWKESAHSWHSRLQVCLQEGEENKRAILVDTGSRFRSRTAGCICAWTAICLVSAGVIGLSPHHCGAQPTSAIVLPVKTPDYTVYLFDEDDDPVEDPDVIIQEGGVYTDTAPPALLGTIDPVTYLIHNASNDTIGFVTVNSIGPGN